MKLPENVWKSKVILNRLEAEARFESNFGFAEKKHYWFTVPEGDSKRGNIELRNFRPSEFDADPHPHQKGMAINLQSALQKEAGFDGVWIVGWTHPPSMAELIRIDGDNCWSRLVMIWLDEDADPKYTLESDIPIFEMIQNGIEYYLSLAHQAHEKWDEAYGKRAMKDDFQIKEGQMKKAALSTIN